MVNTHETVTVTVTLTELDNSHDGTVAKIQLREISTTLPTELKRLTNQPCKNSTHTPARCPLSFPASPDPPASRSLCAKKAARDDPEKVAEYHAAAPRLHAALRAGPNAAPVPAPVAAARAATAAGFWLAVPSEVVTPTGPAFVGRSVLQCSTGRRTARFVGR